MPLPSRYWADLPWPAFKNLPANTVAVLPVASIEQHGPHLPVAVDTTINRGVITHTLAVLPPECPVLVLPTQSVGLSVEHLAFPGTLTTNAETMLELIVDIGASVARAGVRKMVIVNSHGGNVALLDVAARRLRIQQKMFVLNAMWARMGRSPTMAADPEECKFGIHGGLSETSVMLALTPDVVHMDKAKNFVSAWQGLGNAFPSMDPLAGAPLAWQAQDLNPAGVTGDASRATAEIGREILEFAGEKMSALWQQVAAFDIDTWLLDQPNANWPEKG